MRIESVQIEKVQDFGDWTTATRLWGRSSFRPWISQTGRTGWYHRILVDGSVAAGDAVALLARPHPDRPHPDWTVARANHVLYVENSNAVSAHALWSLAELSASPFSQAVSGVP